MYERITGEDPYKVPMRIYPALHYTMGGLWVDYNLMSTIPGLFVARRGQLLRPRRQPPGRQRADAGAGRRLLRPARTPSATTWRRPSCEKVDPTHPAFREAEAEVTRRTTQLLEIKGTAHGGFVPPRAGPADVGQLRHGPHRRGPQAGAARSPSCASEFWQNVNVLGAGEELNQSLEKAGRVADFFELAELMCIDALHRDGVVRRPLPRGAPDARGRGAARRRQLLLRRRRGSGTGADKAPVLHKEPLTFEYVHLAQRSYK